MIALVHGLVGAALGTWIGRPDLAAVAGFASHAVLDAVPHSDYTTATAGALDALAALAVVAAVGAAGHGDAAVAGGIAAMAPDVEVALQHVLGWPRRCLYPSHNGLLPHPQVPAPLGVVTQILAAAVAVAGLALH